jgi:hypothetical protein
MTYPRWTYFPAESRPPDWVHPFISVVAAARSDIDTMTVDGLSSDDVLACLRPGLVSLGYDIEAGKAKADKILRPVLFGDEGKELVRYEVDGVHDDLGIIIEVEAGRGAQSNAVYRDLIRTSLIVGARFLIIGVMQEYRSLNKGNVSRVHSYEDSLAQLRAIYASRRLALPFEGVLLFGY